MSTTSRKNGRTSTKRTTKRTSTTDSLQNGIKVLSYAIKNNISMATASRKNGFGRNYVSDIKLRLERNYENKNISRDLYRTFKSLHKEYNKVVK